MKAHVDSLAALGVASGPLNPHVNAVTSDVIKVLSCSNSNKKSVIVLAHVLQSHYISM